MRVYYEDTDAAGIVYYANYLKFFERCRTEWLRALGLEQRALARDHHVQFVVAQLGVDYVRPARLDDTLTIRARIGRLGASFVVFEQDAVREPADDAPAGSAGELLARATVKVASIDTRRGMPVRLPGLLVERLRPNNAQ